MVFTQSHLVHACMRPLSVPLPPKGPLRVRRCSDAPFRYPPPGSSILSFRTGTGKNWTARPERQFSTGIPVNWKSGSQFSSFHLVFQCS